MSSWDGNGGSGGDTFARPETVVNADGARGTPTIVARRRAGEERAGGEEEWLVGVSVCIYLLGWCEACDENKIVGEGFEI